MLAGLANEYTAVSVIRNAKTSETQLHLDSENDDVECPCTKNFKYICYTNRRMIRSFIVGQLN